MPLSELSDNAIPLILFGAGSHAKLVISTLVDSPGWHLAGLISTDARVPLQQVLGYPVLGDESVLPGLLASGLRHIHVCLDDNQARARASQRLAAMGFELTSIRHPESRILLAGRLGAGSLMCIYSVLDADTEVGQGCIIQSYTNVGHNTRLGDFVQLANSVHTGGACVLGNEVFVGFGAAILPQVHVGRGAVIGANAVVREDVPAYAVVEGNPGRVVAIRTP